MVTPMFLTQSFNIFIDIDGNIFRGIFGNNGNGLHINFYGDKDWYKKYKSHRKNGPASIDFDGDQYYYIDNLLHRDDGPAINWKYSRQWYKHGKIHREDGPAIIILDKDENIIEEEQQWCFEDKRIDCSNQEEFDRLIRLKLLW